MCVGCNVFNVLQLRDILALWSLCEITFLNDATKCQHITNDTPEILAEERGEAKEKTKRKKFHL